MVKHILDELNEDNSLLYKRDVLLKYKDNILFQQVCAMTYDKVKYTYGISLKNISGDPASISGGNMDLTSALDILNSKYVTREWSGNKAKDELHNILSSLEPDDAYIVERIIDRDLKINIGRTEMNKVWKNLITKPAYMRCGILGEKTLKKINFDKGAILQLKADGTYRTVTKRDGEVTVESRSGEPYEYPQIEKAMEDKPDGVYVGELMVRGVTNRAEANGMINSSNPPHDKIYMQTWDFILLDEFYSRPKDKKNKMPYRERLCVLEDIIEGCDKLELIPTLWVQNLRETMEQTLTWMNAGLEGAVLKDHENIFVDHTSPTQLKIKLEIELEVRATGFTEGKKGTKREKTFGALTFETDDGKIKGQTSGFSDKQLDDFSARRDELIGKVFTIVCTDISKSKTNDYYALLHPRFEDFRDDKDETDTLERAFELKELAMKIGEEQE